MPTDQIEREEKRLCLLRILYESAKAVRGKTCRSLMDDLGYPTGWDEFMKIVEYLRSERLIHVFPPHIADDMTNVAESKYVQMLMSAGFDSAEAAVFMMKIAPRGKHCLEGHEVVLGVARR